MKMLSESVKKNGIKLVSTTCDKIWIRKIDNITEGEAVQELGRANKFALFNIYLQTIAKSPFSIR